MVHGDVDQWRSKWEGYGFLLAKSAIMMNAEILKERMKPKNIKDNIGRDQWDYSNERVIGTGKGWNWNVVNSDYQYTGIQTTGKFPEVDDSLMRASGPTIIDSSGRKGDAANYADYANMEVLDKEFVLGKGLLLKAIQNVNNDYLNSLKEHKSPTDHEIHTARTLLKLVWHLNNTQNFDSLDEWNEICNYLNDDFLKQLNNIPERIDRKQYNKKEIEHFREEFKSKSDSREDSGILHSFKEVICESFWLIEIVEEWDLLSRKTLMVI